MTEAEVRVEVGAEAKVRVEVGAEAGAGAKVEAEVQVPSRMLLLLVVPVQVFMAARVKQTKIMTEMKSLAVIAIDTGQWTVITWRKSSMSTQH